MINAMLGLQIALQVSALAFSVIILVLAWQMHRARYRIIQRIIRPIYLLLMAARRVSALLLSLGLAASLVSEIDRIWLPLTISFFILMETILQLYDALEKWQKWKRNQRP